MQRRVSLSLTIPFLQGFAVAVILAYHRTLGDLFTFIDPRTCLFDHRYVLREI